MRRLLTTMAIVACAALASGVPAKADLFYTLDQSGCTGGCSPGPFGVVDLTQVDSNTVAVTVTLENGAKFVATGAGDALVFNILNHPAITVTGLTSGFAVDTSSPPIHVGAFGDFGYGVVCTVPTGCGNGGSNPNPGPLEFSTVNGSALSITDFVKNAGGYFFASDIIAGNGKTGNVASNSDPVSINPLLGGSVPEPASLALLGVGLLGTVAFARRRRA